jgi:hypothetical protein
MNSTYQIARRWFRLGLRKGLVHPLCRTLYRDTDPDISRTLLIAGTARSGTTWLAELLGARLPCRIMFEPFNPRKVPAYAAFNYFQYMRPENDDPVLEDYCRAVFTGRIRDPWIDRQVSHLWPRHRIIKEIRANLLLKWISDRFAEMPILFLIRHPCAVVASRMQLGWDTDADIEPLLSQPRLASDFLHDKLDLIQGCRTPEEKHAVIWSISNLVPLRQFEHGSLHLVFYEELLSRPEAELPRVFRLSGLDYDEATLARLTRPSATTVNFREVAAGGQDLARWKRSLTSGQIERVLAIVEKFGLGDLYGDSPMPAFGRRHRRTPGAAP